MNSDKKEKIKNLLTKISDLSEEQKEIVLKRLNIMNPEKHVLSPRNQLLLYIQSRIQHLEINFTVVAGFRQWLKYGRCVEKGQKGFLIAVPSQKPKPDEDENVDDPDVFFFWKSVFDISQTYEIEKKQAA